MKPFWGIGPVCALALLASNAGTAHAAWCNVFQVCCNSCGGQSAVSHYAPAPAPACNTCPQQQVCTTRYVQRCYYQPVTSYQTRTFYEPVTTYRTSYYYEPVTSYHYSSYYDACSCSYQQVACPTTCYRLRSQNCPVQSWVQRCTQVPVTSYQVSSYYEPVTSCCTQPAPCCPQPAPCCPTAQSAPAAAPQTAYSPNTNYAPNTQAAPAVTEQRQAPGVREYPDRGTNGNNSGSPLYERYYGPTQKAPDRMNGVQGSSYRQAIPSAPASVPVPVPVPVAPPQVRLDRIVSLPQTPGQVASAENAQRSAVTLKFVSSPAQ